MNASHSFLAGLRCFGIFLALLLPSLRAGVQATYYVSPTGSDANPGTLTQPFATIPKARDTVRSINASMSGDIIVYLRGGTYNLSASQNFNEVDSGTNGYKIYYQNYPGEQPELVGGANITGWTLDTTSPVSIYKAYVGTSYHPYAVFENGIRAVVARTPNTGFLNTSETATAAEKPDPFISIEAENRNAAISGGGILIKYDGPTQLVAYNFGSNAYLGYSSLDFRSAGGAKFVAVMGVAPAYAGKQIEIHLDSSTGTLVGTLTLASTGSSSTFAAQSCTLTTTPTGVHNVYLVFKGTGSAWDVQLDWLYFQPASGNDFAPVEAESATSSSGTTVATGTTGTSGSVIASCNTEDWIFLPQLDFGTFGANKLQIQASAPPGSEGMKMLVRLDSLTAPYASGTITLSSTRSIDLYKTFGTDLLNVTGKHDVYLKFRGGSSDICKIDWVKLRPRYERREFVFNPGDIPSSIDTASAQVAIYPGLKTFHYEEDILQIGAIDYTNNLITLQTPTSYNIGPGPTTGAPSTSQSVEYFLQGAKSFIDRPGEFYLDESAGYLYYCPRTTPISSQTIIAAQTTRLFSLAGSSATSEVHDIVFSGLTLNISNFAKTTVGITHEASIYMQNVSNITVTNCKILNAGVNAVMLFQGAQNISITNNLITGFGFNGIYALGYFLGTGTFASADAAYVNKNNVFSNNVIRSGGQNITLGSGVELWESGDNEVSHNLIERMPNWGVGALSSAYFSFSYLNLYGTDVTDTNKYTFNHTRNNTIVYNDLFNCLFGSNDNGVIYTYCTGTNNYIAANVVHDSQSDVNLTPGIYGIYLDADSSYSTVTNNLVYGLSQPQSSNCFGLMIRGQYNTITNNIVADNNADVDVHFDNFLPNYPDLHQTFTQNILSSPVATKVYSFNAAQMWDSNTLDASDNNVVYHTSGTYNFPFAGAATGTVAWADWLQIESNRYDQNSSHGTDPLFQDSAHHNYTLQAGSPALAKGFTNIDTTPVGLTSDFPSALDTVLTEGFENGFYQWTMTDGTPTISTLHSHSGGHAFAMTADTAEIQHNFPLPALNKVAVVWMYDDTSRTNALVMAFADANAIPCGLGVYTAIDSTHYVYRIGSTYYGTSFPRSTGWHQFTWDYRDGSNGYLYVDGTLVTTTASVVNLKRLAIGDNWADGRTSDVFYFDDISVQDHLPFNLFNEGFEYGFRNWKTLFGVPRLSDSPSHPGGVAYSPIQDQDAIEYDFGINYAKTAEIWFYDDAANSGMMELAYVDGNLTKVGLGVNTGLSTTKYVYDLGGTFVTTTVTRTSGWHKLTWNYSGGAGVSLAIDGASVGSTTAVTTFNQIRLGDFWSDGKVGDACFDNVSVY